MRNRREAVLRTFAILTILSALLWPHMVLSGSPPLAFVFNTGSKDVTLINSVTQARLVTKPIGAGVQLVSNEQPFYDGHLVWTYENLPDRQVDVIALDMGRLEVVHRVHVGTGHAESVVLTKDMRRAIVNLHEENRLVIVDTAAAHVVGEIAVGKGPCDLARSPDGSVAYTPERQQDTVAMINLTSLQVERRAEFPKGSEPFMLRTSPDGRFVWVMTAKTNNLVILDGHTLEKVATLTLGRLPLTVGFTPDGRYGYVTHAADYFISVIDAHTFQEATRIWVTPYGVGLGMVSFRPDGKFAYVAVPGANGVGVIDVAQQKLIKLIPAGTRPAGVLFMPSL